MSNFIKLIFFGPWPGLDRSVKYANFAREEKITMFAKFIFYESEKLQPYYNNYVLHMKDKITKS